MKYWCHVKINNLNSIVSGRGKPDTGIRWSIRPDIRPNIQLVFLKKRLKIVVYLKPNCAVVHSCLLHYIYIERLSNFLSFSRYCPPAEASDRLLWQPGWRWGRRRGECGTQGRLDHLYQVRAVCFSQCRSRSRRNRDPKSNKCVVVRSDPTVVCHSLQKN